MMNSQWWPDGHTKKGCFYLTSEDWCSCHKTWCTGYRICKVYNTQTFIEGKFTNGKAQRIPKEE